MSESFVGDQPHLQSMRQDRAKPTEEPVIEGNMSEKTVYVVDDVEQVRRSLCNMISEMGYSTAQFGSANEFLDACTDDTQGVLLLDVKMPEVDGLQLLSILRERNSRVAVIMMSGVGEIRTCVEAMKNGALDFLEKPFEAEELKGCIEMGLGHLKVETQEYSEAQKKIDDLTEQERIVMNGIVQGKPNKQIAGELDMSIRTVQFRRSSLMKKLDVETRAQLIAFVLTAQGSTKT